MVIGFDGSRAFTSDKTGTENYSYHLLRALAKIDHKNEYIVYLRPGTNIITKWPENFQFKIINFRRLWTQMGLVIQTFKDPLDILFVPAHTLPLIRKPGLKTVVTVHDLGSEYLPKTHQFKQRLYLSLMQKYQLKTASKLIAVSEATKKDLVQKLGIDPKKITVIYEGFDKSLFKPAKFDILVNSLRQYGLKKEEYFLFVGTIQPRKNLERVIEAFHLYLKLPKLLKLLRLVIVGSKGWLANEIYELPKKLGMEKQVKFLGYVADRNLPALYCGAKALLFPSLFEGFGLPLLEAQACGCPVITSNISSMPEVAGQGAILVDPYSIEGIAHGMMELENKKTKIRLIKKGFDNLKRFSWEKCTVQTLKVFEDL